MHKTDNININAAMVVFHDDHHGRSGQSLPKHTLTSPPADKALMHSLLSLTPADPQNVTFTIPANWKHSLGHDFNIISMTSHKLPLTQLNLQQNLSGWIIIANANNPGQISPKWLSNYLPTACQDILALTIDPSLNANCETMSIIPSSQIAGFSRHYTDSAVPTNDTDQWPNFVFIRSSMAHAFSNDLLVPADYLQFIERCNANKLSNRHLKVPGKSYDLRSPDQMLEFISVQGELTDHQIPANCSIDPSAQLLGPVLIGQNVTIDNSATITGPAIICDNAKIASNSLIARSIIGPSLTHDDTQPINNSAIFKDAHSKLHKKIALTSENPSNLSLIHNNQIKDRFKNWPPFMYPSFFKRIFDILFASIILIFFMPIFAIVAIAIKLISPGPVFYRARRQGRFGLNFDCLKFRSMIVSAEDIQETLRVVNEVDGPQFKMEDDPRVTFIGRFMRKTYIDEIPQFINVLLGQMSVIGPRPSPQRENAFCPPWIQARLSVRPGITGLWQIHRTRMPGCDFQEWIHYDIKYVRNLSIWADAKIFFQTITKLSRNFIDQF